MASQGTKFQLVCNFLVGSETDLHWRGAIVSTLGQGTKIPACHGTARRIKLTKKYKANPKPTMSAVSL